MEISVLDAFKMVVARDLSKLYAVRDRIPGIDKSAFEEWFWKVKPLFQADVSFPNEVSIRVNDTQEIVPKGE